MPNNKTEPSKCVEYKEKVKETIKVKPFESLGVAFGVGVLLGVGLTALALKGCRR